MLTTIIIIKKLIKSTKRSNFLKAGILLIRKVKAKTRLKLP